MFRRSGERIPAAESCPLEAIGPTLPLGVRSRPRSAAPSVKILIASSIDPQAIGALRERHEVVCAFGAPASELERLIAGCEVLIFRSGVDITAEVMRAAPELRLLLRAGSGIDNLDLDHVGRRGLELIRIPEPGARAVAELTFALMLGLARQLLVADRLLRQGRWAKHLLTGHLLSGKILGIVGAGSIGTLVGELGAAWGMRVLGCVDPATDVATEQLRRKGIRLAPFDEVVATADFLCLHVPLHDRTRHLIDAEALSCMKPGAFLLNLARGGVVDERALAEALRAGRLAGAALDVHEREGEGEISPLAEFPNVILTPHIGSMAIDAQREIGRRILAHVTALETTGRPVPLTESP